MNEFFTSIKALIEKVNLIVLLLSLAVSIFVFKVWLTDLVWAAFVFCLAYPCIAGIHKLIVYQYKEHQAKVSIEKRNAQIEKEKQAKEEQTKAHLCTIFESLSDEAKKGLIMLYRLPVPKDGFLNARIVNNDCEEHNLIWSSICKAYSIIIGNNTLVWRDSILNQIIHIDPDFYKVLEEKSKTFDL